MSLIQGMSYLTPVLGVIRLGQVVELRGKRVPKKNDFFTITEPYKEAGEWVKHPLNEQLTPRDSTGAEEKLRSIPVKVLYTKPELNLSERYEAYSRDSKRLVCAGDGKTAKRLENNKIVECECPGDAFCDYGQKNNCGVFGRALFKIEGQSDEMGAFIVRYGSYNGVNALRAKIEALTAAYGEKLPHMPLRLVMRSKSSPISMNSVFYYPDIELAGEPITLATAAKAKVEAYQQAGIDTQSYEARMLELLHNGRFEIDPSETFDDREEFLAPIEGVEIAGDGASGEGDGATRVTARAPFKTKKQLPQPGTSLGDLSALVGAAPNPM